MVRNWDAIRIANAAGAYTRLPLQIGTVVGFTCIHYTKAPHVSF